VVSLFCGFEIAGCVVVEWEEERMLVPFLNWIWLNVYWYIGKSAGVA
jgi:hypothetical protein